MFDIWLNYFFAPAKSDLREPPKLPFLVLKKICISDPFLAENKSKPNKIKNKKIGALTKIWD